MIPLVRQSLRGCLVSTRAHALVHGGRRADPSADYHSRCSVRAHDPRTKLQLPTHSNGISIQSNHTSLPMRAMASTPLPSTQDDFELHVQLLACENKPLDSFLTVLDECWQRGVRPDGRCMQTMSQLLGRHWQAAVAQSTLNAKDHRLQWFFSVLQEQFEKVQLDAQYRPTRVVDIFYWLSKTRILFPADLHTALVTHLQKIVPNLDSKSIANVLYPMALAGVRYDAALLEAVTVRVTQLAPTLPAHDISKILRALSILQRDATCPTATLQALCDRVLVCCTLYPAIEVATILFALSHFLSRNRATYGPMFQPLLPRLYARVANLHGHFDAKNVATTFFALAVLQTVETPSRVLLESLRARAARLAVQFDSQKIAMILSACARLGLPTDKLLLDTFLVSLKAQQKAGKLRLWPKQAVQIILQLVVSERGEREELAAFVLAAINVKQCNPIDLVSLIGRASEMQVAVPDALFEQVLVFARANRFQSEQVCHLLLAFASLPPFPRFYSDLVPVLLKQFANPKHTNLPMLLRALRAVHLRPPHAIYSQMLATAFLPPSTIPSFFSGLAAVGVTPERARIDSMMKMYLNKPVARHGQLGHLWALCFWDWFALPVHLDTLLGLLKQPTDPRLGLEHWTFAKQVGAYLRLDGKQQQATELQAQVLDPQVWRNAQRQDAPRRAWCEEVGQVLPSFMQDIEINAFDEATGLDIDVRARIQGHTVAVLLPLPGHGMFVGLDKPTDGLVGMHLFREKLLRKAGLRVITILPDQWHRAADRESMVQSLLDDEVAQTT